MNRDKRKIFNAIARRLGWLLTAAHSAVLMFAFYCIIYAGRISDNGDVADTAWGAALLRNMMWGLIVLTILSSSFFLLIRIVLKRRADRMRDLES